MRTLGLLLLVLLPIDDDDLYLRQGDALYADFRTRDAIALYTRAYHADPHDYHTLVRLSRAWSDIGRLSLRASDSSETYYRTALQYAQELIAAHPDSATSWFMLALCHGSLTPFKSLPEKLDIAQDVERNLLRSLEIDPSYSMSHVLLGIYCRGVSRLSWVERTIVNGILGRAIYGTLEDSERHLLEALRLDPRNSFAHYEMYGTLRSMGRQDESLDALRKVISLSPTNERERHQYKDAQRRLDRALADDIPG